MAICLIPLGDCKRLLESGSFLNNSLFLTLQEAERPRWSECLMRVYSVLQDGDLLIHYLPSKRYQYCVVTWQNTWKSKWA